MSVDEGYGPLEMRVRLDIGLLGDLTGIQGSLAETAYALAKQIDEGAGMGTASVARELRLLLSEITKGSASDDDPASGIIAGLGIPDRPGVQASVRNTKDGGEADPGTEGQ